jgi:hypothetical protein
MVAVDSIAFYSRRCCSVDPVGFDLSNGFGWEC